MSDSSKARRAAKRARNGTTLSDEDRRLQLREDPLVQGLVAEALRTYAQRVQAGLKERDAFGRSLAILVSRIPGGRVVITPMEVEAARTWRMQTLFDKGAVVHYVIRDEHEMQAAALRAKAAKSGLVIP